MKIKNIITALSLSIATMLPVAAQEQYLHIYRGNAVDKSYKLSSIDSMLLDDSYGSSNIYLYRDGNRHKAGSYSGVERMEIGGELTPSGIYMGIIGFNEDIYPKTISSLSTATKNNFTSFVNNLTNTARSTALYYGVYKAIDQLKATDLPEDLVNVSIVTFTDGLDNVSSMLYDSYESADEWTEAINSRIQNERIGGVPITAYAIGLRGDDITNVTQFSKNLQALSSSADNAIEVSDISEVEAKYDDIVNDIYNESTINTVSLTIPGGYGSGTRIRFTFDNVSNATSSTMYIEGTYQLKDRSLTDVTYCGLSCSNGATIKGEQNGVYVTFTFEDIQTLTSVAVNSNYIDQWYYVSESSYWQINSEFTPDSDSRLEVKRKSTVIMLVLDCSSSLGSQFSTVKTQANNFIGKLAGYGNSVGFEFIDLDEENAKIDTDIFSELEYDEMVFVKGGTFTMGATSEQGSDAYDWEKPTHQVTLSGYHIGKYEVTQQLWEYVMNYTGTCADGSTMSAYSSDPWLGTNPSSSNGDGNYYPAYYVSWNDIVNVFLPRLNRITGRSFRLPTEAEWEYAARGGNKSKGYKYSGSNDIGSVAWYYDNAYNTSNNYGTHQVGTKAPNELGIYDMTGNVWEWCQDWYGSYSSSAQTNPTGPASGSYRVHRGGSWFYYTRLCRVSDRYFTTPDDRANDLGFRLVCP